MVPVVCDFIPNQKPWFLFFFLNIFEYEWGIIYFEVVGAKHSTVNYPLVQSRIADSPLSRLARVVTSLNDIDWSQAVKSSWISNIGLVEKYNGREFLTTCS
jgi:hypothetical protein